MKEFLGFCLNIIILLAILWALFFFVIGIQMAPNDDMSPRISAGDIVLFYRLDKSAAIQDVVIVEKNDTEYLGRVVAKSGDTVEITKEENLIINGNMVVESNIFYSTPPYEGYTEYPLTLKADECFILTDKREGGEDSRYFGPVTKDEIKGTVVGQFRRNGI